MNDIYEVPKTSEDVPVESLRLFTIGYHKDILDAIEYLKYCPIIKGWVN